MRQLVNVRSACKGVLGECGSALRGSRYSPKHYMPAFKRSVAKGLVFPGIVEVKRCLERVVPHKCNGFCHQVQGTASKRAEKKVKL